MELGNASIGMEKQPKLGMLQGGINLNLDVYYMNSRSSTTPLMVPNCGTCPPGQKTERADDCGVSVRIDAGPARQCRIGRCPPRLRADGGPRGGEFATFAAR